MGWLPQAIRRDVGAPAKYSNGPMRSHTGIVLHVNDSQGDQVTSVNGDSLYTWITGDHGMSCHFQVSQMGVIEQYIDTQYSSWCQADGNDDYLSIETEGHPSTPLTPLQVRACAAILAFVHAEHGIPLRLADQPGQSGFGWHGMGAPSWGHASCPGDIRKAQRAQILTLAATGGPAPEDTLSAAEVAEIKAAITTQAAADRQWLQNYVDAKLGGTINRIVAINTKVTAAADLPAIIDEKLSHLPAGASVDAQALATAVLDGLSQRLDNAAGGPA